MKPYRKETIMAVQTFTPAKQVITTTTTTQAVTPAKQGQKWVKIVFWMMFASPFVLTLYIMAQIYATYMRFH
jgi:hypothetical protein